MKTSALLQGWADAAIAALSSILLVGTLEGIVGGDLRRQQVRFGLRAEVLNYSTRARCCCES